MCHSRPFHRGRAADHQYDSHAEKHCEDIPHPDRTLVVGLCSGLWAGAAISITPSLPDLVPVGVQTVLLAFRVGSYVHTIAEQFSPTPAHDSSASWTRIFPLTDYQRTAATLAEFQETTVRAASTEAGSAPRTLQLGRADVFTGNPPSQSRLRQRCDTQQHRSIWASHHSPDGDEQGRFAP